MDLVARAREYAINAHKRIDHRRKYSGQPYTVHLAAVARQVASVTDDPVTIAAAWLHDTVEDTPATFHDIEQTFGAEVARLVEQLTDVSRPGDGNRAVRKALDREHLARAEPRAQTVKLADLIDNARDICRHDPRFARLYLDEMAALLDVLKLGDSTLMAEAHSVLDACRQRLAGKPLADEPPPPPRAPERHDHLMRLFTESFTAQDIAEPLRSFDASHDSADLRAVMDTHGLSLIGLREAGAITGYVRRSELEDASGPPPLRQFRTGQRLPADASLSEVIHVLTIHQYAFITALGDVIGVVSREEINKPVVRMWLFGIVTFIEMEVTEMIRERYPEGGWEASLSRGRLDKARALLAERQRRGHACDLLDCLQFSDKGQILLEDPVTLRYLGFDTKGAARQVLKELESLRNHLAHAQDIVTHDWAPIVRLTRRLEESLSLRRVPLDSE